MRKKILKMINLTLRQKKLERKNSISCGMNLKIKKNTDANNVYTASEAMRLTCAYTRPLYTIKKEKIDSSISKYSNSRKKEIYNRWIYK
jgi:hypothetical protein